MDYRFDMIEAVENTSVLSLGYASVTLKTLYLISVRITKAFGLPKLSLLCYCNKVMLFLCRLTVN